MYSLFLSHTQKIQRLQGRATRALSIFTKTLDKLQKLNDHILREKEVSDEKILQQTTFNEGLLVHKLNNDKIIAKIKSILED